MPLFLSLVHIRENASMLTKDQRNEFITECEPHPRSDAQPSWKTVRS